MLEASRVGGAAFDVFTTAPRWFFEESLGDRFTYHEEVVDVGFRQRSALHVDVPATVAAVGDFLPFDEEWVARVADRVRSAGCRAVLCDIAPLGVAAAQAAGLPSVLLENFSWGWLYEPYFDVEPGLRGLARELDRWTTSATVHVQARPMCVRDRALEAVDPIARPPRRDRPETRRALGVPPDVPLVVVTMGGYAEDLSFVPRLRDMTGVHFLVTGASRTDTAANVHLFDNATPLYMPDVLRAADGVVAKLGYGMVSEVWREGLPFAHVTRPGFREMASLERFAEAELSGFLLDDLEFSHGDWIRRLPELLAMPRRPHAGGGAGRVAEILLTLAD
jgi:hypothetical protein